MLFLIFGVGSNELGDDGEVEKAHLASLLLSVLLVSPSPFREFKIPSISRRSVAFSFLILSLMLSLMLPLMLSLMLPLMASRQRGSNWRLTPANSEELVDDVDEGVRILVLFLLLDFVLLSVLLPLVPVLVPVPVPLVLPVPLLPLVPVPGGWGDLYI